MQYAADIKSSLEAVLNAAIEMLGADMGHIQVADPATKALRIAVWQGMDEQHLPHFQEISDACNSAGEQSQRTREMIRKTIIVPDVMLDENVAAWREESQKVGYRGGVCTPLFNRHGELMGVLSAQFKTPCNPSPNQLQMLELYARQAVDALNSGRMALAALRSMAFLRFLDAWNESTRDLEIPEEIIELTVQQLSAALNCDSCRFEEYQPARENIVVRRTKSSGHLLPASEYAIKTLGHQAVEKLFLGRAVTINECASEKLKLAPRRAGEKTKNASSLLCPVLRGRQLVCLLTVHQYSQREWLPDEISLVQQVADRCWSQIERGRAVRELRASEFRNRTFLTTVPTAVWFTDGRGRMVRQNDSWARYTGQTWDDYQGSGWLDAIHPSDRESVECLWAESLKTGTHFEAGFQLRRHDGTYRHISARGAPVPGESGIVQEWIGICDDIHQHVLSSTRNHFLLDLDKALRTEVDPQAMTQIAVRMLGEFLNVDRCGWAEIDEDQESFNVIGDYNIGVHSTVGRYKLFSYGDQFKSTLLSGHPFVTNDSHKDPIAEGVRAEFDHMEVRAAIYVPLMKGGRLTAVFDVQQRVPREWSPDEVRLLQDVSSRCWESIQRAHVSQELRQNEYRLRLAQRAGRIGSFEWLIQEDRFFWSAELQALYGLPLGTQETTFGDWAAMCLPEDAERIRLLIDSTLKSGGTDIAYEFRTNLQSPPQRWLRGQAIFLYDAAGNPREMIGVNIDIDGQKRATDELRDADRRKDEFLATLAHELRNPLAPIQNAIEILQLGENDDRSIDAMHHAIERQVQQLVRLVDDLLDVSRITRGKIDLQRSKITLQQVLANAVETSRPVIDSAGQSLVCEIPDTPLWLEADQTRLAQVFANLLNNAAKYSDPGGRISIQVEQRQKEVDVHISDTGIGIPVEMHDRIFEPFTQVEGSVQRSRGGLGIGLTLVKRLVELHGGRVAVSSGSGTTLTVTLPVSREEAPLSAWPPETKQPPLERKRILVVDDTPAVLYMMGRLLEKIGQTVFTAENAIDGLETAFRLQPDIVISDIGMPSIDGYQLAAMMRAQPLLRRVRLVALTGYGQEADRNHALSAGFDQHLVKPVSLDTLRRLLIDLEQQN